MVFFACYYSVFGTPRVMAFPKVTIIYMLQNAFEDLLYCYLVVTHTYMLACVHTYKYIPNVPIECLAFLFRIRKVWVQRSFLAEVSDD